MAYIVSAQASAATIPGVEAVVDVSVDAQNVVTPTNKKKKTVEPWSIDQIMGDENDCDANGGTILGANGLGAPLHGFHLITWSSINIRCQNAMTLNFKIKAMTEKAKALPIPDDLNISLRGVSKKKKVKRIRDKVTEWCVKNPGFSICIGGPGDRATNAELARFHRTDIGRTPLTGTTSCVTAAFAHAVMLWRGWESGRRVMALLESHCEKGRGIPYLGDWLQRNGVRMQMRKAQAAWKSFSKYSSSVTDDSVLVVRLTAPGGLDHAVCVDVRNGVIFDNCEACALQMCEASLRGCAGGHSRAQIVEALFIAEYPTYVKRTKQSIPARRMPLSEAITP